MHFIQTLSNIDMNLRHGILTAAALLVLGGAGNGASAQTTFTSELTVKNNGGGTITLNWGLDPAATDAIDQQLGETELPPLPPGPEVFWVRFFDAPGHTGLGTGVEKDIRGARSKSQIDTFLIRFQAGSGGYPVTITWPAEVQTKAKRLVLKSLIDSVDMLTNTSYTITIDAIDRLTLIREADAASSVEPETVGAAGIEMERVVPNPASRGGSIAYTLPTPGHVTMKLYDAAGVEVATLVDGEQTAERHTVAIDAERLAPGAYFCKLEVDGNIVTRTFVIGE